MSIKKKLLGTTLALGLVGTGIFAASANAKEITPEEGVKMLENGVEYSVEYVNALINEDTESIDLMGSTRYWHGTHYSSVGVLNVISEYLPREVSEGKASATGTYTDYGPWVKTNNWSRAKAPTNYKGTNYTNFDYRL